MWTNICFIKSVFYTISLFCFFKYYRRSNLTIIAKRQVYLSFDLLDQIFSCQKFTYTNRSYLVAFPFNDLNMNQILGVFSQNFAVIYANTSWQNWCNSDLQNWSLDFFFLLVSFSLAYPILFCPLPADLLKPHSELSTCLILIWRTPLLAYWGLQLLPDRKTGQVLPVLGSR